MTPIKAVALDIDGVLTDGALWFGPNGEELKRLCFQDIMGVSLAHKAGLVTVLISGESGPMIDRLAHKIGVRHVYQGCKDKKAVIGQFAEAHEFHFNEIAFIGDDINDVEAMKICGLSAAPANAHQAAKEIAKIVTEAAGGNGAVREFIDLLLVDKTN